MLQTIKGDRFDLHMNEQVKSVDNFYVAMFFDDIISVVSSKSQKRLDYVDHQSGNVWVPIVKTSSNKKNRNQIENGLPESPPTNLLFSATGWHHFKWVSAGTVPCKGRFWDADAMFFTGTGTFKTQWLQNGIW